MFAVLVWLLARMLSLLEGGPLFALLSCVFSSNCGICMRLCRQSPVHFDSCVAIRCSVGMHIVLVWSVVFVCRCMFPFEFWILNYNCNPLECCCSGFILWRVFARLVAYTSLGFAIRIYICSSILYLIGNWF